MQAEDHEKDVIRNKQSIIQQCLVDHLALFSFNVRALNQWSITLFQRWLFLDKTPDSLCTPTSFIIERSFRSLNWWFELFHFRWWNLLLNLETHSRHLTSVHFFGSHYLIIAGLTLFFAHLHFNLST